MLLKWSKGLLSAMTLPVGIGLVVEGSVADAHPATSATPVAAVSYANDVKPILDEHCVTCHGGMYEGETRIEDSLDLTTYEGLMVGSEYGTVIEAGDPDNSVLIDMVQKGDMPDEGDPLPQELIDVIRTWVAEGAQNN